MQITADIVIFKIIDNELNVLLIQRARDPFEGERCLP